MRRWIALTTIAAIAIGCAKPSDAVPDRALDQFLESEIAEGRLKGAHAVVFKDDSLVYDRYVGVRDAESADSMRGNETYYIQSMTKPVTTVALMTLFDEGKFTLDDPVEQYLPEFRGRTVVNDPAKGTAGGAHPAPTPMTIRQLLSHTAGMSHGLTQAKYDREVWDAAVVRPHKVLTDRIGALAELPLMFEPGSRWNYSFATDLVARLIEVLAGKPLETFVTERVLVPLRMTHTGYNLTAEDAARVMTVYDVMSDSTLRRADGQPAPTGNTLHAGVNTLFSTTHDYLRFARMLLNEGELDGVRILKPETVRLLHTDQTTNITARPRRASKFIPVATGIVFDAEGNGNLEPGYGFGLGFGILTDPIEAQRPDVPAGEFFWSGANSTYFFINPASKLIGMLMTQIGFLPHVNPFHFHYGDAMRKATYADFGRPTAAQP